MIKLCRLVTAALVCTGLALAPSISSAAESATLPVGSRLYLSLDQSVTSARGAFDAGDIIRCRVWRDVEVSGVVFIKAGTPASCRVEKIDRRNMGGFEGKVAIGGVETKSVDGQSVILSGGYNKGGSGRKAVVWTAGLLLFFPILFVPGGNAELPPGTVFDVETGSDITLAPTTVAGAPRRVDLRTLGGTALKAEFMLDDFIAQPKHDVFRISLAKDGQLPSGLVIDNVNGKAIEPIALAVKPGIVKSGQATGVGEVSPKVLAKHVARGINRFEIAYQEDGQRHAIEVVMDVQM